MVSFEGESCTAMECVRQFSLMVSSSVNAYDRTLCIEGLFQSVGGEVILRLRRASYKLYFGGVGSYLEWRSYVIT